MKPALAKAFSDWRWYFHSAAAEMGIRSSWEPMCAVLNGVRVVDSAMDGGMDDRRLSAARRHSRIEYALMLMDANHLCLVRLVAEQAPHGFRLAFGELGNIAHYTEEAIAARDMARSRKGVSAFTDRLGMRLANGKATKAEQLIATQIRDGTEKLLEKAQQDYSSCRRRAAR